MSTKSKNFGDSPGLALAMIDYWYWPTFLRVKGNTTVQMIDVCGEVSNADGQLEVARHN